MFGEIEPIEDRVGLGPGDCLVFFTDGVTEARAQDGTMFGESRLLDLLANCPGCAAEEVASRVVNAATSFASESHSDDVAVLVLGVPDGARDDPVGRVVEATGVAEVDLRLPGYPHGDPPRDSDAMGATPPAGSAP
jgi:hypothetical protein